MFWVYVTLVDDECGRDKTCPVNADCPVLNSTMSTPTADDTTECLYANGALQCITSRMTYFQVEHIAMFVCRG